MELVDLNTTHKRSLYCHSLTGDGGLRGVVSMELVDLNTSHKYSLYCPSLTGGFGRSEHCFQTFIVLSFTESVLAWH